MILKLLHLTSKLTSVSRVADYIGLTLILYSAFREKTTKYYTTLPWYTVHTLKRTRTPFTEYSRCDIFGLYEPRAASNVRLK